MNRFKTFADPEEVAAAAAFKKTEQKKQAPKENKKVVIKKVENAAAAGDDGFESVDDRRNAPKDKRPATGNTRGGRGGRGDRRGGRGGRGVAREGGRRFEGKPREDAHPMDKKSGTGRGKRDTQKGGHGKGNWGTDKAAADAGKKEVVEETKDEPVKTNDNEVEEQKVEEFEEVTIVQEVGISLDDFLAQKAAASTGLLNQKAAGRSHEKQSSKGIEVSDVQKKRVTTIDSKLTGKDVYGVRPLEGAELLGFSGGDDDFEAGKSAGGRGDRERRDRTGN